MVQNRINYCIFHKFINSQSTFHKNDGIIKIGRMTGCHIKFEDFSLSRYQCSITWEDNNWILRDGDGQKFSTNGTWYFKRQYNIT